MLASNILLKLNFKKALANANYFSYLSDSVRSDLTPPFKHIAKQTFHAVTNFPVGIPSYYLIHACNKSA